ncbi:MAG: hypothetical protein ACREO8_13160 [Luteimonas sp.]
MTPSIDPTHCARATTARLAAADIVHCAAIEPLGDDAGALRIEYLTSAAHSITLQTTS